MTATTLHFRIAFNGPFHVGSGLPEQGLDRVLDRDHPLPASSLKGVMRAGAAEQLGLPTALVDDVFGAKTGRPAAASPGGGGAGPRRRGSPWAWSDARFDDVHYRRAATIRIDDATGITSRGFLMVGEQAWATHADFSVELRQVLDERTLDRHQLVLRAAARSVLGLGGSRRRGQGWVDIVDVTEHEVEVPWTEVDSCDLMALGAPRTEQPSTQGQGERQGEAARR